MTYLGSALALVTAVAAVAVAAGPASAYAREYLSRLEAPADDSTPESPGTKHGTDHVDQPPRVRARWMLHSLTQAALSSLLAALTLTWGLRAHAVTDTVTALPTTILLVPACSVDAVCHRLPSRLLGAAGAWVAAAAALTALVPLLTAQGRPSEALWPLTRALLCALGAGGSTLVLALLPCGLGLGDVRLSAVLGLWLGHLGAGSAATGIVLGFLLAGAAASVLMVTRRVGRHDHLAVGPYLAVGGWLAWLAALR